MANTDWLDLAVVPLQTFTATDPDFLPRSLSGFDFFFSL
jgi:hypothetical protein